MLNCTYHVNVLENKQVNPRGEKLENLCNIFQGDFKNMRNKLKNPKNLRKILKKSQKPWKNSQKSQKSLEKSHEI